ncbi:hypothetical protein [Burkholderia cepacia]|uniref:hypothetical protein n=1 Tax=Burkholderia cepacia TaxID=292 RepID=UPI00298FC544|nr:hypothetical protein [Burkholderia cepacia]MDW9243626.1 hypothetical protein [Burkholderia cepacia]
MPAPGELLSWIVVDARRFDVYCDQAPEKDTVQTADTLLRKLRASRAYDAAEEGSSQLAGHELKPEYGSTACRISTEDGHTVRMQYRLILCFVSRVIGYLTFGLTFDDGSVGSRPAFFVELGEVWIEPKFRHQGLGPDFAQSVANLVLDALTELDKRLAEQGVSPEKPLTLDWYLGAEAYSLSGKLFVESVGDALCCALDDAVVENTLPHLKFGSACIEPRE